MPVMTDAPQYDPLKQIRDDLNTHIGRMRKVQDPTASAVWTELMRTFAPLLRQTVEFVDFLRLRTWEEFEKLNADLAEFDERMGELEGDMQESQLTDEHATLFAETLAGSKAVIEEALGTGLQTPEVKTKLDELVGRIVECQAVVDDIRLPPEEDEEGEGGDEGEEPGEEGPEPAGTPS